LGQPEAFSISKGLLKKAPGFRPLFHFKRPPGPKDSDFFENHLIPGRFIVCKSESPSNNTGNPIRKIESKN
jgi:hypothetical protein